MDFDRSKENIQPLRGGRNVTLLGEALQAQTNQDLQKKLMQQKGYFEHLIQTYSGDDPLQNWYDYISWAEQSYPKHGHEGNVNVLLETCLKQFEHEERYKDDRRLCKLFIKFIDQQASPLELYHMMYAQGICRGCADMYKAWAYYFEAVGDFQNAHRIFECGKHHLAQPFDELQQAHESLVIAAGRHVIYGVNETELSEKRRALTSLHTFESAQVGSIRTGETPTFGSVVPNPSNSSISIYKDREDGIGVEGVEVAPNSIIAVARRQDISKENTLKPGPWTTLTKGKSSGRQAPSFKVHEDDCDAAPMSHVSETLENYSNWIVSLTLPETVPGNFMPMYPKAKVYAEVNTEYSLEELRARRYPLKNNEQEMNELIIVEDEEEAISEPPPNPEPFHVQEHPKSPPDVNHNNTLFAEIFSPNVSNRLVFPESSTSQNVFNRRSPKFSVYDQFKLNARKQGEATGSAMKTPFKDLNAEELAETGSRGGMDIAAAAAPMDGAKRIPSFEDDDENLYDNYNDISCNTQMFCNNLNAMKVSTPQGKQQSTSWRSNNDASVEMATKRLFHSSDPTLVHEKTMFGTDLQQKNLNITAEHNKNLKQNLMVNAALRNSSLGALMDFDSNPDKTLVPSVEMRQTQVQPIDFVPSDPFKQSLIQDFLERVHFPGVHTDGFIPVANIPRLFVRKECITIGSNDKYVIEKELGKGTYGVVFRGIDVRTRHTVAIKYQKPANKWEFYICRELQARLAQHPLRDRFMNITIGYFSATASVLVSEFMPCGSLLDVANAVKQKTGRPMRESLCIHFCLEMLQVVAALHEAKIIHADIKPDNFLVQALPTLEVRLQLIDFGCSIDMTLFPENASFTRKVATEDFICCEMLDNRPWNYHTDLFCIAATAHVLLFEKYIQLQNREGLWSISNRLPRYARVDLWNTFFSTLLNQQNGPADSTFLQNMLRDSLNHKFDSYHSELRFLTNILKNR